MYTFTNNARYYYAINLVLILAYKIAKYGKCCDQEEITKKPIILNIKITRWHRSLNVECYFSNVPVCRISRSQIFFGIVVLKNFSIFRGKTSALESLFNKVAAATLLKRNSTQVFPVNCEILKNRFLYRTPPVATSIC